MAPPPRKWLSDRISGQSKYNDRERPCGPCCWVPPPVGWLPSLCEENICCKLWGMVGFYRSEQSRFWCMHTGFIANFCAFLLFSYTCFAISLDFNIISKSAFGSLTLTEVRGGFDEEVTMDIGLRAVALNNSVTGPGLVVVPFDQFCNLVGSGLERYMDPADCDSCNEISLNLVVSALIAVASFVPTFFTDILRMYSGYDVNCQKCFGIFFSLCTVLLALNTMFTFKFFCGDTFYQDYSVYFDRNGDRIPIGEPTDNAEFQVDFKYTWGWGLMMMLVATVLKFLEVLCHFCVPTPTITRDRKEQDIYEVVKDEDFP